jgi:hypothetical protein
MTLRSIYNNTNVPLAPFGTFTGQFEPTSTYLEISAYINSTAYLAVSIQQSQDASTVLVNTTYNYTPTDEVTVFNTGVGLPFYRIILTNEANVQVAHMALTTILTAIPNTAVTATIAGPVTVTGSVVASNLITETLATRRVDFLVVGDYYRVASVGITTGAQWNQIGAIVDGESVPVIGRLFKCLAIGPAVAGGGECYDVEYTDAVSATVTNLITETLATRRVDFLVVGDYYRVASVGITSGAEWNQIGAIVNGESAPVIGRLFKCLQAGPAVAGGGECYDVEYTDAVSATITNFPSFPAVQAVSGTVSLTDPTTVRVRDSNGDPILTTAGNLMVGINNIYTANPLHTIVDSGSVTATPPSASAISFVSASTTGQTIKASAGVLKGLYISSDGSTGTGYVKLYNVAVPTSADIPVLVVAVLHATSQTIDTFSLGFSTAIGVRATDGSANNDNVVPTNNINVTGFYV